MNEVQKTASNRSSGTLDKKYTLRDISAEWNYAHPHLIPYEQHLPLHHSRSIAIAGTQYRALQAAVRVSEAEAQDKTVLYNPENKQFYLHEVRLPDDAHISVNAKLWSSGEQILNIEPTTECNFNCWYCIGRHMKTAVITEADFQQIIDHSSGVRLLALVGEGEPLMHPQIFELISYAKAHGMKVYLITNGSHFTEDFVEKIIRCGLDYISITIDGITQDTFKRTRVGGKLHQVWEGIARLQNRKAAHRSLLPVLGLKVTVMQETKGEIAEIVHSALEHGIEYLEALQPLNPKQNYAAIYPAQKKEELADYSSVAAAIAAFEATYKAPTLFDRIAADLPGIFSGGHRALFPSYCDLQVSYALASGLMTPCCQIKTAEHPQWDLRTRPLAAVLGDPDFENLRFNLYNGIYPLSCAGCHKTTAPDSAPNSTAQMG